MLYAIIIVFALAAVFRLITLKNWLTVLLLFGIFAYSGWKTHPETNTLQWQH
jgi:hypothetical protein